MLTRLWLVPMLMALSAPPLANAASYYDGKTITIVVGYKPGGGYDRYARLFAKHLTKYIPGSPTAIIQNVPGANSIIAANQIFSASKPDGLTIGTFNNGLVIAQLIKVEGGEIRFDEICLAWQRRQRCCGAHGADRSPL